MPATLVAPLVAPLGSVSAVATKTAANSIALGHLLLQTDMTDEPPRRHYIHTLAPLRRQQFDTGEEAGEQSLGDSWWRRAQEDWSGGAGQIWYDKKESNRTRFYESKGIDPFTNAPSVILLKDTALNTNMDSAETNLFLVRIDSGGTQYAYFVAGQTLKRTTDPFAASVTLTTITGVPAAAIASATSDGEYVYTSYAASGIYRSAISGTTSTSWSATNADLVRYVKGRIMSARAGVVSEHASGGVATTRAVSGITSANFVWTDFAEIGPAILACGYIGERSSVYRFTVKADGTLDVGIEAMEGGLPAGEIIHSMRSYLGFVFLGTSRGLRMATHDASGNLTYGPLIPDANVAVRALEAQDNFLWFSWTNYDGTSTGLGRIDLRTFTAELRPAYASDLMATAQGNVLSIITHGDKRVFAVSGSGFWSEKTTYVASGVLTCSKIQYRIPEKKIAKLVDVNSDMSDGTITPGIAPSTGVFVDLAVCDHDDCSVSAGSMRSPVHQLRFTIAPVAGGATSPELRDCALKALPAVKPQHVFEVPVLIQDFHLNEYGQSIGYPGKGAEDLRTLFSYADLGDSVTYEGLSSGVAGILVRLEVFVDHIEFHAYRGPGLGEGFGGWAVLTLRDPNL